MTPSSTKTHPITRLGKPDGRHLNSNRHLRRRRLVRLKAEKALIKFKMLASNFRAAAKFLGDYCDVRNELRIRKGRKIYRFTCGYSGLRVEASGTDEVVIPIAPDATVSELRRGITYLIDEH